jgi:chemotaxis signal transduction protein/chemotaxis methyl-accepting protein methylase
MNENAGALAQEKREEAKGRIAKIDFKMVTFALAGKDYGIDIMSVKEIAKAGRFTYVPNAANFVRGVYNLRGEIISVIDLRTMFHLPAERKEEDQLENLLILKVAEHVFGVIVDSIDKVVGISNESIQPPHPIFGDINVKYIRGVVESSSRLYIILDIAKIFAPKEERTEEERKAEALHMTESARLAEGSRMSFAGRESPVEERSGDLALNFIKETLFTFKHFGVSQVNESWVEKRYGEWKKARKADDLQLKESEDADSFLEGFYSPHTALFWDEAYMKELIALLPDLPGKTVSAWNPGCGRGYETYSFAVALRERYPDSRIKVWANDSDLLNISMAPNLVFEPDELPAFYKKHVVKGKSGLAFNAAIRDSISFEYHDVLNSNPLPDVDFILCRDVLSFMSVAEQGRIVSEFMEKLKPSGLLFLGTNEDLSGTEGWKPVGSGPVSAFSRQA